MGFERTISPVKILILGARGWLGGLFYDYLLNMGYDVTHRHEDINSIKKLDPDVDVVVNFAASANIDWCEKNKNRTFQNNVLGSVNVAKVCKEAKAKYVFISSACILKSEDENDIKYENDKTHPRCFYTETKLMAEKLITEIDNDALILRLRLPVSEVSHPRNLLNKLIGYERLIDCQESMVVVEDMLPRILELIQEGAIGIRHLVSEGTISPAEVGKLIGHDFEVITKDVLDKQMTSEKRATRTSTIIGTRHGYLPPIRNRIADVVVKWKATCN